MTEKAKNVTTPNNIIEKTPKNSAYLKHTRFGGRSLEAIWSNDKLNSHEVLVLQAFASELNFEGDFLEKRYMSISRLMKRTRLGKSAILYVLNGRKHKDRYDLGLVQRGYLEKEHRQNKKGGNDACNYNLTELIFKEYYETEQVQNKLKNNAEEPQFALQTATRTPVCTANLPASHCKPQTPSVNSSNEKTSSDVSVCNSNDHIYEPQNSGRQTLDPNDHAVVSRAKEVENYFRPEKGKKFLSWELFNKRVRDMLLKFGMDSYIHFIDFLKEKYNASHINRLFFSVGNWNSLIKEFESHQKKPLNAPVVNVESKEELYYRQLLDRAF